MQYFYHSDHLGSASFVTDREGAVCQHLQYLPFGELFISQRNSEFDSRYKFTAKELDNETSYTYFGARYYDSDLSSWLSVDPLSDKYPALSPYCYSADNPVVMLDPNGTSISEFNENGNYIQLLREGYTIYNNIGKNKQGMRTFISILLCSIFLSNCKAQDPDFKIYLNNFGQSKIPLLINDRQSSSAVFCQAYDTIFRIKVTKPIQENIVAKYICTNGFCNPDGGYFRYDYGVKVDLSNDFITVLVSKLQYEGDSEWDFDLRETLLITYNNKGEILSRLSLTKDNDRWKSSLMITKERITVRQIKITEPKIEQYDRDLRCEYWTTTYQITSDGIIKLIDTSPVFTGILIWDKIKEEYVLKE